MLILPLHKKPTRENFPWVTLALVLANVAVFALLQGGDQQVEMDAAEAYIERGVLEQEWEWFGEWAEYHSGVEPSPERVDEFFGEVGDSHQADMIRLQLIDSEPRFLEAIEDGEFAAPGSEAYQRWEQARERLAADREASFTRSWMLRYDRFDPATALTHMFMHGGIGHLIGNMLFLVLLGLLLEGALGGGRYLALYLVSGLGAVGASLAVHWGAPGGGIGASGAIAGLMGLFAVVYGMRKVRFFYWAFVYFDYVRAPALILLPLWLGWEVLAFMLDDGGNIAYEAHIGGILCGAGLGLLARRTGQVRQSFIDAESVLEDDRDTIAKARAALEQSNAPAAKNLLRPLLARHGHETRLWQMYFAACRQRPNDPDLHTTAARILHLPGDTPEQRELMSESFRQYRQATNGRIKLPVRRAVWLANKFALWGETEASAFLIDRLARAGRPIPGLAAASHALAEGLRRERAESDRIDHYARLARELPEAAQ